MYLGTYTYPILNDLCILIFDIAAIFSLSTANYCHCTQLIQSSLISQLATSLDFSQCCWLIASKVVLGGVARGKGLTEKSFVGV